MPGGRPTLILFVICGLAWGAIVLHRVSDTLGSVVTEASVPQAEVQEFARARLAEMQQQSFDHDIELCGLVAENSAGELVARTTRVGDEASCDAAYFDVHSLLPRATMHTHAAFNPDYDSEVPSTIDVQGDMTSGIDGYVSTPGGRFWHVDGRAGIARQVCGEGCLPQDSDYDPCDALPPQREYTLQGLRERERSVWTGC
ncbi:DUF4329 domain-containing protein [Aurantiacibacter gilvus]|uniref:DUF4329 domain-containing protein n=1 Tax=Aurantiacibacter gilvus TaxID=3139141 RepID=A0ABU9ID87_9SPHN